MGEEIVEEGKLGREETIVLSGNISLILLSSEFCPVILRGSVAKSFFRLNSPENYLERK